jgi:hypothetical protein
VLARPFFVVGPLSFYSDVTGLILLGQTIFSVAIMFKIYWLAVLGRFVFGLGGESLTVAQNSFTARYVLCLVNAHVAGGLKESSSLSPSDWWYPSLELVLRSTFSSLLISPLWEFPSPFGSVQVLEALLHYLTSVEMCLLSFLAVGFVGLLDWYGEAAVQRRKERLGLYFVTLHSVALIVRL